MFGALYDIQKSIDFTVKGSSKKITLSPEHKSLCLNKQGPITLVADTCYKFDKELVLDTSNDKPVVVSPSSYLVEGTVNLELSKVIKNRE